MPILKVKTALYLALLSGFWLGSGSVVFAQNYVDIDSYGGQQVTVNFDALDDGAADPYSTTPFSNPGFMLQEDLPVVPAARILPQTAPLVLTRPVVRPQPFVAPLVAPVAQMAPTLPAALPAELPSALPPQFAPPAMPPVVAQAAPLPQTVQPLGVTAPSKPLPVVATSPAFAPKAVRLSDSLPTKRPAAHMVAKAVPLPTPAPMPVVAIQQMPIAALPPALPTLPVILSDKAQALPDSVVAVRTQAVAAADAPQRVLFMPGSDVLTAQGRQQLGALAQLLGAETATRVQLRAYAAGSVDDPSDARRLSLARGLAVRGQLLQQGARPAQIDVRALGAAGGSGTDPVTGGMMPADRVDVIVLR